MENEVLDNFHLWKKAVLIAGINQNRFEKKGGMTIKEITQEINSLETDSYFRKVIKFIEEYNYCTVDKSRFPYKYNIDSKKLAFGLKKGTCFEYFKKVIELTNFKFCGILFADY